METQAVLNKIVEAIVADIQRDDTNIAMYDELAKLFEPFEGKQITKRMATKVEKAHPDWIVYYSTNYGMYQLYIYGEVLGRMYDDRAVFLFGHVGSSDTFTMERFEYHNTAYGRAARERNEKRRAMLKDEKGLFRMAWAFCEYIEAKERWEGVQGGSYNNPSYYSIRDALGVK